LARSTDPDPIAGFGEDLGVLFVGVDRIVATVCYQRLLGPSAGDVSRLGAELSLEFGEFFNGFAREHGAASRRLGAVDPGGFGARGFGEVS